jgi:hypothetical protein
MEFPILMAGQAVAPGLKTVLWLPTDAYFSDGVDPVT